MNQEIVGIWELVSYEFFDKDGIKELPFGEDPIGYIIYLPNGYLSAHIGARNRPHIKSLSSLDASAEEAAKMVKSSNSYFGRYEVKKSTVHHSIEVALFPNWEGITLERNFEIKGDTLRFWHTYERNKGLKTFSVTWKRVKNGF